MTSVPRGVSARRSWESGRFPAMSRITSYRAAPPFDEGVRARCAYGCADHPDAVGAEHFVEGRRELAVAVVDQEPDWFRAVDERLDHVPCLLGRPLSCRVPGDSREIHLPR